MPDLGEKDLTFVTLEGLFAYGESLANCPRVEGAPVPPSPVLAPDRVQKARAAVEEVALFATRCGKGLADTAAYREARRGLLQKACEGDELVMFAAWNKCLAEGRLSSLFRSPIGRVLKPLQRRPVAVVPRAHLTAQLVEGKIVIDLGNDRYWLLPRDLSGRTLLFTLRHGVSRVESGTHRVGRSLANCL